MAMLFSCVTHAADLALSHEHNKAKWRINSIESSVFSALECTIDHGELKYFQGNPAFVRRMKTSEFTM